MTGENTRVLKVAPGKTPEAVVIPNTPGAMQQMVGRYIEAIPLEDVCLVCSEGSKLMRLPGSRRLGDDIIAGTFFLTGDTPDGHFCSLIRKRVDRWDQHFAQSEVFQPDEIERRIHIRFYTM